MAVDIPDKFYFKIGEVASLTGVKPHVLRYWESEFRMFSPAKSRGKQRQYERRDIELALEIKELLYEQGFTIAGARKHLKARKKNIDSVPVTLTDREYLCEIRKELQKLRARLP
ncbi:MAG: MerR family transcriptional regulator [Desulfuromonadaceae bacterium]|nr:MerR family transcriptional regulator [Desulfuromonas sp.]MDY0184612.1 MerR family transcriptional regulator [Desulfuromonadaceae bacterium]